MFHYFRFATAMMIIAFSALFMYTGSWLFLYQAATLTVVEIAVSFDNAVVNAAKLHTMNALWKRMFLTIGILVAVGFMRFYLPLQIVAIIDGIGIGEAYDLAVNDPNRFSVVLTEAHISVAGFGGAFLMMVALNFFTSSEKEVHWLSVIEKPLNWIALPKVDTESWVGASVIGSIRLAIMGGLVYGATALTRFSLDAATYRELFVAVTFGLLVYVAVHALKECMEILDERLASSKVSWLAGGLGTFIYLEVLDASFSFDGVIAAFAISKNIFVVAVGLGVGALFVRSMTIMLDEKGALAEYKYLENGAMLAILALSIVMFVSACFHVPEWVTASSSVLLIGAAFWHSKIEKNEEESNNLGCILRD